MVGDTCHHTPVFGLAVVGLVVGGVGEAVGKAVGAAVSSCTHVWPETSVV